MKQHVKIFPVDIYKRGVCVFFGTRDQLKQYFKKENIEYDWKGEETDEMLDKSQAVCFRLDTDVLIYSEREISESVLIHEIIHASKHILRLVDIDDEEAFAYLTEYLCDQILPWSRTISSSTSDDARSE